MDSVQLGMIDRCQEAPSHNCVIAFEITPIIVFSLTVSHPTMMGSDGVLLRFGEPSGKRDRIALRPCYGLTNSKVSMNAMGSGPKRLLGQQPCHAAEEQTK